MSILIQHTRLSVALAQDSESHPPGAVAMMPGYQARGRRGAIDPSFCRSLCKGIATFDICKVGIPFHHLNHTWSCLCHYQTQLPPLPDTCGGLLPFPYDDLPKSIMEQLVVFIL